MPKDIKFAEETRRALERGVKMEVKVGDKVIFSKYAGNEIKADGENYIILRQSDILAIVEL